MRMLILVLVPLFTCTVAWSSTSVPDTDTVNPAHHDIHSVDLSSSTNSSGEKVLKVTVCVRSCPASNGAKQSIVFQIGGAKVKFESGNFGWWVYVQRKGESDYGTARAPSQHFTSSSYTTTEPNGTTSSSTRCCITADLKTSLDLGIGESGMSMWSATNTDLNGPTVTDTLSSGQYKW